MPITKEILKAEIDRVEEKYLEALYRIIKALEDRPPTQSDKTEWQQFIEATYGSTHQAPIERGPQGVLEVRDSLT